MQSVERNAFRPTALLLRLRRGAPVRVIARNNVLEVWVSTPASGVITSPQPPICGGAGDPRGWPSTGTSSTGCPSKA